jgi:hypothetical protein
MGTVLVVFHQGMGDDWFLLKAIVVSGSPRKKWNTAVLLQKKACRLQWGRQVRALLL